MNANSRVHSTSPVFHLRTDASNRESPKNMKIIISLTVLQETLSDVQYIGLVYPPQHLNAVFNGNVRLLGHIGGHVMPHYKSCHNKTIQVENENQKRVTILT